MSNPGAFIRLSFLFADLNAKKYFSRSMVNHKFKERDIRKFLTAVRQPF